jgi:serine/threonine-protein kinase
MPILTGQQIGNYQIVRKLGEGGMGAVFEAVHTQIGRRAAIKVLHGHLAENPEISARFLNEARATNIVQHPGMVAIVEFGQLPEGGAYIVMEYLEGETLTGRLRRCGGKLGIDGLQLFRQIASALAAAHAHGVVHRDLKPDNVMIVKDPEAAGGERAKVLDFGIAKVAEAGPASSNMKTRTGMMMGTPAYMSPEQCRGAGQVDDRSDVYSLGVMLYQALAGRLPFQAEGLGELIGMQMFSKPPPLRDLAPATPQELVNLVEAMLAKTPAERPSMNQVVAALEGLGAARATPTPQGALPTPVLPAPAMPTPVLPQASTPLPAPGAAVSTLSQAVGQGGTLAGGGRGTAILSGVVAAALALGGVGLFQFLQGRKEKQPVVTVTPPPQAPPPAAPQVVRWSVVTRPAGAQVIGKEDGKVLGVTPWETGREARPAALVVLLRREGFEDKELVLSQSSNEVREVALTPLPRPGPGEDDEGEKPGKGDSSKGRGRHRREREAPAAAATPTPAPATAAPATPTPRQPGKPVIKEDRDVPLVE